VSFAAPAGDLPALRMEHADHIRHQLVITVEVAGSANKSHVAANAGKVLSELGHHAHGGILVVINRTVAERIPNQRSRKRGSRELTPNGRRGLPIEEGIVERSISRAAVYRSVGR